MKKKGLLGIAVLLAVGTLMACGAKTGEAAKTTVAESQTQTSGSQTGTEAKTSAEQAGLTSFTAKTIDGEEVNEEIFADYDLTMINIWGTFCGPCINEMPDLGEINEEYKDKGFQVVGIVIDVLGQDGSVSQEQLDLAKEIVDTTKASYTHLVPSYDLIFAKLKDVSAIPETVFVDKDGNYVGKSYLGSKSKEQWIKIIDSVLEELQ